MSARGALTMLTEPAVASSAGVSSLPALR